MHNPPHPGLTIRDDILPALGLSATEGANAIGISESEFIKVINGQSPITHKLALQIQGWLGVDNGGDANNWIRQQAAYDER